MEKIYEYENGTICILGVDSYDREKFKNATVRFLKKVLIGGNTNGDSNSSGNFREK
jgi:hypothetical protein